MEMPTYGGLRKLQKYCAANGFPLPEFWEHGAESFSDLNNPNLDLSLAVKTGSLFNPETATAIWFDSKLPENYPQPFQSNFMQEYPRVTVAMNMVTKMCGVAQGESSAAPAFLEWFGRNQTKIEMISRWGVENPSLKDMIFGIFFPRRYARRAYS